MTPLWAPSSSRAAAFFSFNPAAATLPTSSLSPGNADALLAHFILFLVVNTQMRNIKFMPFQVDFVIKNYVPPVIFTFSKNFICTTERKGSDILKCAHTRYYILETMAALTCTTRSEIFYRLPAMSVHLNVLVFNASLFRKVRALSWPFKIQACPFLYSCTKDYTYISTVHAHQIWSHILVLIEWSIMQ